MVSQSLYGSNPTINSGFRKITSLLICTLMYLDIMLNVFSLFVVIHYQHIVFRVHASRYVHNLVPEVVVYIRHMPHLAGQNLL